MCLISKQTSEINSESLFLQKLTVFPTTNQMLLNKIKFENIEELQMNRTPNEKNYKSNLMFLKL